MFTLEEGHTPHQEEKVLPTKVSERYTPPELLWRNQGDRSVHWASLEACAQATAAPEPEATPEPPRSPPPVPVEVERLRPFFKQQVNTHSGGPARALTGGLTSG